MREESRSSWDLGQLMVLVQNPLTSQPALLGAKRQREGLRVDKETRTMIKTGIKGGCFVLWKWKWRWKCIGIESGLSLE